MKKIALSLAVLAGSAAYVWIQWGAAQPDSLLPALDAAQPAVAPAKPSPTASAGDQPIVPKVVPFVTETPSAALPAAVPAAVPPLPAPVPTPAAEQTPLPPLPKPAAMATTPPEPAPPAPVEPQRVAANVPMPRLRPPYPPPGSAPLASPRPAPLPVAARITSAVGGLADGTYDGPAVDAYYGIVQIEAIVSGGRLSGIRVLRYPSDRRTSIFINRQALPLLRDEAISAQNAAGVDIISGATLTSEAFIRSLGGALKQASA